MIGALLWIPAFAGMTGESFAGMTGESFAGITGEIFVGMAGEAFAGMAGESFAGIGGNPWLLFSFSMIILRHSRVGGSMVAVLVLHDNTESFPRRRIHGCCSRSP